MRSSRLERGPGRRGRALTLRRCAPRPAGCRGCRGRSSRARNAKRCLSRSGRAWATAISARPCSGRPVAACSLSALAGSVAPGCRSRPSRARPLRLPSIATRAGRRPWPPRASPSCSGTQRLGPLPPLRILARPRRPFLPLPPGEGLRVRLPSLILGVGLRLFVDARSRVHSAHEWPDRLYTSGNVDPSLSSSVA